MSQTAKSESTNDSGDSGKRKGVPAEGRGGFAASEDGGEVDGDAQYALVDVLDLDELKQWMFDIGLSVTYAVACVNYVRRFLTTYGSHYVDEFAARHVRKAVRDNDFSQSAKVSYYAALKNLFRYLYQEGLTPTEDPFDGWSPRAPRGQKPISVVTLEDVQAMLGCSELTDRERALIRFLFETGARAGAVAQMKIDDISEVNGNIIARIKQEKTGQDMYIERSISRATYGMIRKFRQTSKSTERLWLMTPASGTEKNLYYVLRRLVSSAVRKTFGYRSAEAQRISAHGFRYAYAQRLDQRGVRLTVIKELLGHAHTRTTERYLRIGRDEINETQRAYLDQLLDPNPDQINPKARDGSPDGKRFGIYMWTRDSVDRELGPVHVLGTRTDKTALKLLADLVKYAGGDDSYLPRHQGRYFKHVAGASRLRLVDHKKDEVVEEWRKP